MFLSDKIRSLLQGTFCGNYERNSEVEHILNKEQKNSEYIDLIAEKKNLILEYPQESLEFKLLKRAESVISKKDDMYAGNAAHYFKVGLSAIRCIEDSISKIGNFKINNVLDMPCGYGRVLRFLHQRFQDASITGIDLVEEAVDFCVNTFGVKGVYSKKKIGDLALESKFDLIWCGSLVTHLDASFTVELLSFFNRHLSCGGLLIFSTHGKPVLERIKNGRSYGLDERAVSMLILSYEETGYGYANYPGQSDYGISVTSPEWLRNLFNNIIDWKEVYYKERGWDNHQDVFCIQKQ